MVSVVHYENAVVEWVKKKMEDYANDNQDVQEKYAERGKKMAEITKKLLDSKVKTDVIGGSNEN